MYKDVRHALRGRFEKGVSGCIARSPLYAAIHEELDVFFRRVQEKMSEFNLGLDIEQLQTFSEVDLHEDIKQVVAERFKASTAKVCISFKWRASNWNGFQRDHYQAEVERRREHREGPRIVDRLLMNRFLTAINHQGTLG